MINQAQALKETRILEPRHAVQNLLTELIDIHVQPNHVFSLLLGNDREYFSLVLEHEEAGEHAVFVEFGCIDGSSRQATCAFHAAFDADEGSVVSLSDDVLYEGERVSYHSILHPLMHHADLPLLGVDLS